MHILRLYGIVSKEGLAKHTCFCIFSVLMCKQSSSRRALQLTDILLLLLLLLLLPLDFRCYHKHQLVLYAINFAFLPSNAPPSRLPIYCMTFSDVITVVLSVHTKKTCVERVTSSQRNNLAFDRRNTPFCEITIQ